MSRRRRLSFVLAAAASVLAGLGAGSLAEARADGYGYDEPSYQPRYAEPETRRCTYRWVEAYDPALGRTVRRRVRVCGDTDYTNQR